MIIFDKQDLFYGSSEHMRDNISRAGAMLLRHRDPHTILSVLASVVAFAKEDLVTILADADDIEGVRAFVGESLGVTVERAEKYFKIAEDEI